MYHDTRKIAETELTASVLKKDPETYKRVKRTVFGQTEQDRVRNVEVSSFSKLRTIQQQRNSCCQLDFCGRKKERVQICSPCLALSSKDKTKSNNNKKRTFFRPFCVFWGLMIRRFLFIRNPYRDRHSKGSDGIASPSGTSVLSPLSSSMTERHGPCLHAGEEKRIKRLRKLLRFFYLKHKTNDWVRRSTFLWANMVLFRQLSRDTSSNGSGMSRATITTLQGALEGGRRCGRQRKHWMDSVKEWISLPMPELPTMSSRKKYWKRISAELSIPPAPPAPPPPNSAQPMSHGTELNWH